MKLDSILKSVVTLAATTVAAWIHLPGVFADGSPTGGGGGAEGVSRAAGDRDPTWMMGTGNGGGVDFGFNQDGGGHSRAITHASGQFDGQAIQPDGGWGDVAFGSVRTNGDAGGEVVARIETDAQPGKGRDVEGGGAVRGRGRVLNGGNGYGGGSSRGVMDVMMPPRAERTVQELPCDETLECFVRCATIYGGQVVGNQVQGNINEWLSDAQQTYYCSKACGSDGRYCGMIDSERYSASLGSCAGASGTDYYSDNVCPNGAKYWKLGPWDINFLELSANFGVSSTEELVLNYDIGKHRQFDSLLFLKDCTTNVDITINYTEPVVTPKNDNFKTLTLGYSIDKSKIASSAIWNATSSKIELCQVVQLKEATMVITEDKRQLSIDFDMLVNYTVNDNALGAETINAGNDTIDVASYIEACKCDGVSFDCNQDALVPGAELVVCIKSISPDVEIDFLDSMIVSQGDANDMAVIKDNTVMFPSFTAREYVPTKNGVVVSTFVPANEFEYNIQGSVIGIAGGLVMKLVDGSGRNLKADIGAKLDAAEEASFEIEVNLQRELGFVGETSLNSAASSIKAVIGPVMLLAWANVMW